MMGINPMEEVEIYEPYAVNTAMTLDFTEEPVFMR